LNSKNLKKKPKKCRGPPTDAAQSKYPDEYCNETLAIMLQMAAKPKMKNPIPCRARILIRII
uniref:Uncharacterized protein n=1 Tax=Romanomermis culicivorax TaxID=13658 RepID=A0A915K055_ROMCU